MSTVKISQLPLITALNANTANSLFMGVDIPTGVTGKFTAHTLAANLFSNEILNVGVNHQNLPNTIAQFSLGGDSYIQTNLVNTNDGGTADIVVTANVGSGGTDAANFIDMGYANKNYQPGSEFNNIGNAVNPKDGYLYVQGTAGSNGGNLIVGTTTSNTTLKFIVGGGTSANIVASMTSNSLVLNTQSFITFADGTKQITAAASNLYSQAAFAAANAATANISVIQGVNTTQNTNITEVNTYAANAYAAANTNANNITVIQGVNSGQNTFTQAAFDKANTSIQNTAVITVNSITLTGNLIANGLGQSASIDNFTSNSATFNQNVTVLGQLNVSSMIYAANGTINRSNTYTGTQTAITVNMATETWVRATVGASLTITPTGFGPGYETEVVVINPNTGGGAARTITHGCSATNSSVGATTFSLGGTTTAFIKYYSFDSDLANTYAKISFS